MRVIYDAWGQMGNRLWEYLDLIAWAKINHSTSYSLFWDSSLRDFDNLRNNPYIKFPFYINSIERNLLGRIYRRSLYIILHNKCVQHLFASTLFSRLGFVSGRYAMFDHKFYPAVLNEIRVVLSPSKDIISKIDSQFIQLRTSYDYLIVGVHIRKGDFRYFYNGYFFYEDNEYVDFMNQVIKIMTRPVKFILVSNEKIDLNIYNQFDVIAFDNQKGIEDMYTLSKCDYIIGPYSTFSAWASLYGDKPYCYFKRGNKISEKDFKVVEFLIPQTEIVKEIPSNI